MASVMPVVNYEADTRLSAPRRHSRTDTGSQSGTAVVTLELMHFVLQEEGVDYRSTRWSAPKNDEAQLTRAVEALKTVLRGMLNEYGAEMRQICSTLEVSDEKFYSTYCAVAENCLGHPNINWGRIVSLMCFTGLLASHLIRRGQECKVESLLGWERTFISNKCHAWIEEHGGWKSFKMTTKETNAGTKGNSLSWLLSVSYGISALAAFFR